MSNLFLDYANGNISQKKILLIVNQNDFNDLVTLARNSGLTITWRSGEEIWGVNPFEKLGESELYIGVRLPKDSDIAVSSDLVCSYFGKDKQNVLEKNYKNIYPRTLDYYGRPQKEANVGRKTRKENKMKLFSGIKGLFGAVDSDRLSMSMKGLAVKDKDGNYVHYDLDSDTFIDVTPVVFDLDTTIAYKVPTPLSQLKPGDIIMDNVTFHMIKEVSNSKIKTINLSNHTSSNKVVVESLFGKDFNLYSKVVPLFDTNGGLDMTNPMTFMLLKDGGNDIDVKDIMLMNAMANGNTNFNPMMLMLMKDDGGFDVETMMLMNMMNGNGGNPFQNLFNLGGQDKAVPADIVKEDKCEDIGDKGQANPTQRKKPGPKPGNKKSQKINAV